MEQALVTDTTGFIGRHLVQTLLARQAETCIVVCSEEKAVRFSVTSRIYG